MAAIELQTLQVLIVEDSNDDALLIIRELKVAGYQVTYERVQTPDDLKQALDNKNWDIVLSDYSMPQFTGIDALKIIKEKKPDLPCIIISGSIGEETAVAAMQAGAQDFFVKDRIHRLPSAVKRELVEAENVRRKQKAEQELRKFELSLAQEREEALKQQIAAREKIEILYREAQESNRMKEEFLTTLSHELRTPMTAITGWSDLLASGECKVEDYPLAFSTINKNAHAQNKLIDDVLDLSRIITGRLKIESNAVDIIEVSKTAIESVLLSLKAKNIDLKTNFDPLVGGILGDASRLKQVILNILSNAIKFTPQNGKITFDIKPMNEKVVLQISDTGSGIEAKFLPYVFDRFRQADSSLNRKFGGLGLGLTLVRHLVEIHGGQVEVKSEGLGKGTTVIIKLPMRGFPEPSLAKTQDAKENELKIERAKQLLKGLKVLVVDDSPDNCLFLNFILKSHGAEVVIAASAREAFPLFSKNHFDVLLCDIEMPEENGYEFVQRIRKNGITVPAAAVTAHVRMEDVDHAIEAGFDRHISKPINESNLVLSVLQLAGKDPLKANLPS